MKAADVDRIIEYLRQVRKRPKMYLSKVDASAALNFLWGFKTACHALGYEVPLGIRERVCVEHGWQWSAHSPELEMKKHGLADEAIVNELLEMAIDEWQYIGHNSVEE